MAHLTLAGLSDDGKRLLLVDTRGNEYTLDVDSSLRHVLRGDRARLGQLEIDMDSALRPRDIQARIRAGEAPEAVAQAAQAPVEKIMPFAAPVLAERAHVADRAQRASVRRPAGEQGARTLGDAVGTHLREQNVPATAVEWDAWRREDGRWTVVARYTSTPRSGTGTWTYDVPGNYVVAEDDDARWLSGEPVGRRTPGEPGARPTSRRRLASVPADEDELPLGEDAIEMVHEEPEDAPATDTVDLDETAARVREGRGQSTGPFLASVTGRQDPGSEDPGSEDPGSEDPGSEDAGESVDRREEQDEEVVDGASPVDDEQVHRDDGSQEEPTPRRRTVRKNRGRASVPSWDEIMFGGGGKD
jgi:hypothetical protein